MNSLVLGFCSIRNLAVSCPVIDDYWAIWFDRTNRARQNSVKNIEKLVVYRGITSVVYGVKSRIGFNFSFSTKYVNVQSLLVVEPVDNGHRQL